MPFNTAKYLELIDFLKKTPKKTKIIAVTKNKPTEFIVEAIKNGHRFFGENKVQEAFLKYFNLKKEHSDLKLHMIGPIQRNKVKKSLEIFDFFHTLDRESLANEFCKYKEKLSEKTFFIQINTGLEDQKSGIGPNNADEFIAYCIFDLKLNVTGLMCIPPFDEDPANHFAMLSNIAKKNNLTNLSMGMSNDYKIACQYGANFIRIGSLLFGKR